MLTSVYLQFRPTISSSRIVVCLPQLSVRTSSPGMMQLPRAVPLAMRFSPDGSMAAKEFDARWTDIRVPNMVIKSLDAIVWGKPQADLKVRTAEGMSTCNDQHWLALVRNSATTSLQ